LLLFAALLLADDAASASKVNAVNTEEAHSNTATDFSEIDNAVAAIEKLAERAESFANNLEQYSN